MQGHVQTHEPPAIPELNAVEAHFGENPLRWLWTRSASGRASPGDGDGQELDTAYARIAGIQDRWLLACWAWAEQVTRDREHVLRRLRRRDVALVTGERRFADTSRYPWERAEQIVDETTGDESSQDEGDEQAEPAAVPGDSLVRAANGQDSPSSLGNCPDCRHSVVEESVAGEIAYWCPRCGDFVARSRDELAGVQTEVVSA